MFTLDGAWDSAASIWCQAGKPALPQNDRMKLFLSTLPRNVNWRNSRCRIQSDQAVGRVVCSLWNPAGLCDTREAVNGRMLDGLKIVSGGQTGADRAALDFAIHHGIAHGGWCPAGRLAEDGPIDACYQLKETPSRDSVQRTEWNVRDSDGTVVFSVATVLTDGSKKTVDFANEHNKPVLCISRQDGSASPEQALLRFIDCHGIKVLNIAGPRASKEPEVAAFVKAVLDKVWAAP